MRLSSVGHVHDALDEYPRRVHLARIELAGLDEFFDLGDRDAPGARAQGIEVLRTLFVDEIAVAVAVARVHQREVGANGVLEDVGPARELAGLLGRRRQGDSPVTVVAQRESALGDLGADPRRSVESGDARAPGAQAFGQGPLGDQFHFEFSGEELTFELLVLTDVRAGRSTYPTRGQEHAQSPVVDTTVVAHRHQILDAHIEESLDEGTGYTA